MTIHHDKLAYGKLAPESENVSEDRIFQMLKELSGEEDNKTAPKDGNSENKKTVTEATSYF